MHVCQILRPLPRWWQHTERPRLPVSRPIAAAATTATKARQRQWALVPQGAYFAWVRSLTEEADIDPFTFFSAKPLSPFCLLVISGAGAAAGASKGSREIRDWPCGRKRKGAEGFEQAIIEAWEKGTPVFDTKGWGGKRYELLSLLTAAQPTLVCCSPACWQVSASTPKVSIFGFEVPPQKVRSARSVAIGGGGGDGGGGSNSGRGSPALVGGASDLSLSAQSDVSGGGGGGGGGDGDAMTEAPSRGRMNWNALMIDLRKVCVTCLWVLST